MAAAGQEPSFDEVCFVVTEFRTFLGHGKHMNGETRQLLARWHALEAGDGLRRVAFTARVLWFVGLGLAMFVALAVTYRLHPAVVAAGAAVMGVAASGEWQQHAESNKIDLGRGPRCRCLRGAHTVLLSMLIVRNREHRARCAPTM